MDATSNKPNADDVNPTIDATEHHDDAVATGGGRFVVRPASPTEDQPATEAELGARSSQTESAQPNQRPPPLVLPPVEPSSPLDPHHPHSAAADQSGEAPVKERGTTSDGIALDAPQTNDVMSSSPNVTDGNTEGGTRVEGTESTEAGPASPRFTVRPVSPAEDPQDVLQAANTGGGSGIEPSATGTMHGDVTHTSPPPSPRFTVRPVSPSPLDTTNTDAGVGTLTAKVEGTNAAPPPSPPRFVVRSASPAQEDAAESDAGEKMANAAGVDINNTEPVSQHQFVVTAATPVDGDTATSDASGTAEESSTLQHKQGVTQASTGITTETPSTITQNLRSESEFMMDSAPPAIEESDAEEYGQGEYDQGEYGPGRSVSETVPFADPTDAERAVGRTPSLTLSIGEVDRHQADDNDTAVHRTLSTLSTSSRFTVVGVDANGTETSDKGAGESSVATSETNKDSVTVNLKPNEPVRAFSFLLFYPIYFYLIINLSLSLSVDDHDFAGPRCRGRRGWVEEGSW